MVKWGINGPFQKIFLTHEYLMAFLFILYDQRVVLRVLN